MHPVFIQTERASIGPDAREWTVSCRYDDKAVWGWEFRLDRRMRRHRVRTRPASPRGRGWPCIGQPRLRRRLRSPYPGIQGRLHPFQSGTCTGLPHHFIRRAHAGRSVGCPHRRLRRVPSGGTRDCGFHHRRQADRVRADAPADLRRGCAHALRHAVDWDVSARRKGLVHPAHRDKHAQESRGRITASPGRAGAP